MRALDSLHDLAYSSTLDGRQLETLAIAAGLSEREASEYRIEREMARMRAGMRP